MSAPAANSPSLTRLAAPLDPSLPSSPAKKQKLSTNAASDDATLPPSTNGSSSGNIPLSPITQQVAALAVVTFSDIKDRLEPHLTEILSLKENAQELLKTLKESLEEETEICNQLKDIEKLKANLEATRKQNERINSIGTKAKSILESLSPLLDSAKKIVHQIGNEELLASLHTRSQGEKPLATPPFPKPKAKFKAKSKPKRTPVTITAGRRRPIKSRPKTNRSNRSIHPLHISNIDRLLSLLLDQLQLFVKSPSPEASNQIMKDWPSLMEQVTLLTHSLESKSNESSTGKKVIGHIKNLHSTVEESAKMLDSPLNPDLHTNEKLLTPEELEKFLGSLEKECQELSLMIKSEGLGEESEKEMEDINRLTSLTSQIPTLMRKHAQLYANLKALEFLSSKGQSPLPKGRGL